MRRRLSSWPGIGVRLLLDQPVDQHSLNRAVQRARPEMQLTTRKLVHLQHDPVAVALAATQGQQNVKDRRRERQEFRGSRDSWGSLLGIDYPRRI